MKLYVEVTLRLNIHFKSGQGFFLSRVGNSISNVKFYLECEILSRAEKSEQKNID